MNAMEIGMIVLGGLCFTIASGIAWIVTAWQKEATRLDEEAQDDGHEYW